MRRQAKKDMNHNAITRALEKIGCSVLDMSRLGDGAPDIAVGFRGKNYLFEIKQTHKHKLTDDEDCFKKTWIGQYAVITNFSEALKVIIQ